MRLFATESAAHTNQKADAVLKYEQQVREMRLSFIDMKEATGKKALPKSMTDAQEEALRAMKLKTLMRHEQRVAERIAAQERLQRMQLEARKEEDSRRAEKYRRTQMSIVQRRLNMVATLDEAEFLTRESIDGYLDKLFVEDEAAESARIAAERERASASNRQQPRRFMGGQRRGRN